MESLAGPAQERLRAVRPDDEALQPPLHATLPFFHHSGLIYKSPVSSATSLNGSSRAQSGNKVAVLFESQVATRLMIRAENLAVA